ncbi:MAG: hypothetical protein WCS87_16460 [Methylococcaceae bacterium]
MKANTSVAILQKGKEIFLNPSPTYSYEDIIGGVTVLGSCQRRKEMRAVESNSFISYRFKGEANKIIDLYIKCFIENKDEIIEKLLKANDRAEIANLADHLRIKIINAYKKENFKTTADINSYNRVRKIIDLYFEHIAAMSIETTNHRESLIPLLSLPLDSKILGCDEIFTDNELKQMSLKRKNTYGSIQKKEIYIKLQNLLINKAQLISPEFYVIYFDLIWGVGGSQNLIPRYKSRGRNLFETNFGIQ